MLWAEQDGGQAVYVDDVTVAQVSDMLVQERHYYPFGQELLSLGYTNGAHYGYRYRYQGQYAEHDEATGWDSFELRTYDSRIGRWLMPDPYGQYWSPYVGMGNNPVNQVDPAGAALPVSRKCRLELQCFTGDFFQAAIVCLYRISSYWQGVR